jgi:hypothetical protein
MAFDIPEPVTLAVICVHCGRPVKMKYVPDGSPWPRQHPWICPYWECRQVAVVSLSGSAPTVTTDVFRRMD